MGTRGSLRGRQHHSDQATQGLHGLEELGDEAREAKRDEEGQSGAGAQMPHTSREVKNVALTYQFLLDLPHISLPERGRDAGTMDQVRPHVRSWHSTTLPKTGRPILSNPIRWRPARRPRTEARPRRTDVSRVKKGIDKPRPVTEADIKRQAGQAGSVENDPLQK